MSNLDSLHGYNVEKGEVPEHDGPSVCVIMVEDTYFRDECVKLYRQTEAEGKSARYCEDCVSDSLGEWEVEWWREQDGRAHESQAYSTTVGIVAPDLETARQKLGEIMKTDPDRWLNVCGWPRLVIYENAPRAPF